MVVAEITLSLVLLIGAGLLFRSFLYLNQVDPGFRPDDVLTLGLTLPASRYSEENSLAEAYQTLERQLNSIPAIRAAGFVSALPLAQDQQGTSFTIEGEPPPSPGEQAGTNFSFVTPGYFGAMGIPLLSGRGITQDDHITAEKVVVVNHELTRRFLPDSSALGKRISLFSTSLRIVGIVGDVRHDGLRTEPNPMIYIPYAQGLWGGTNLSLIIRSEALSGSVLNLVREQIRSFDPEIPVYNVKTLNQVFGDGLAKERFSTLMLIMFSACALLLAGIGIYGIISYSAVLRTRETGIRMALGAEQGDIVTQFLTQGAKLAVFGILLGLAASLALTGVLENLLYQVSPTDAWTFAAVSCLLMGVALLASLIPALRAARLNPVHALRSE